MIKTFSRSLALLVAIVFVLISCGKDDEDAPITSRVVRYEIAGNYTGKLDMLTTTNTSQVVSYNGISLPWTKEITYPNSVTGVGIGGNSTSGAVGVSGQTGTLRVFSGDKLLYAKAVTAGANGVLTFPTYTFVFE